MQHPLGLQGPQVFGNDAVDARRVRPPLLAALVEVVVDLRLLRVVGVDVVKDRFRRRLGNQGVQAMGSVPGHLVDGHEGEGVLFQTAEPLGVLVEGGCGGLGIQFTQPSLLSVEQDHAVQRVQRGRIEVNGHQGLVRAGVDDFVDGAIRFGQDAARTHAKGAAFPQLLLLRVEFVFDVLHLALDAEDIPPEPLVVMDGTFDARRPVEHHDFEGVQQEDVSGVIVRHPFNGGNAAPQVQFARIHAAHQVPHPLEIEVRGGGCADGVEQGLHGFRRCRPKIARDGTCVQWRGQTSGWNETFTARVGYRGSIPTCFAHVHPTHCEL